VFRVPARPPTRTTDSLFFRSLRPAEGWEGGRTATAAFQRVRLLDAITTAVAEKGYNQVTLSDVVGRASVSRRTFYAHFESKEACFLAAYEAGAEVLIAELRALPQDDWRERLAAAIASFLANLAADPGFARTFLVDVVAAGPKAIELRQHVHGRFAERFAWLSEQASKQEPEIEPVGEFWLRALVGGISEVVERHVFEHGAETLPELQAPLVELATAVLAGRR
jgi:AcrR family transcriptional regulator